MTDRHKADHGRDHGLVTIRAQQRIRHRVHILLEQGLVQEHVPILDLWMHLHILLQGFLQDRQTKRPVLGWIDPLTQSLLQGYVQGCSPIDNLHRSVIVRAVETVLVDRVLDQGDASRTTIGKLTKGGRRVVDEFWRDVVCEKSRQRSKG